MTETECTRRFVRSCLPSSETGMSRRYLRLIGRWMPVCLDSFREWPDRPRCGHFFGGVHWYGIETAWPMSLLAAVSTSPEYENFQ